MKRIKQILKSIQTIIDDKLGNPFIFDYQKLLFKLTLVLLIALFVVLRGCTAPLLIDNAITRFLFLSDQNGDKTLYNIGISVIAAYIFYLVQVHIPEQTRCKKQLNVFSQFNKHQIFILEQYIKAWNTFLGHKNNLYFCHFREFSYTTNHGKYNLTKMVYEETVAELTDNIDKLMEHPNFDKADSAYQELIALLYYKLDGFKYFIADTFPSWSEQPLKLSKNEYILIKDRLREFSRFSKRLQNIEKYAYAIEDKISPYEGKSLLQKMAEELL